MRGRAGDLPDILADESPRAKCPDNPFLSLFRQHDEFDMALSGYRRPHRI